jgi:glycerol-3-phosphate acyltransferase PlsX
LAAEVIRGGETARGGDTARGGGAASAPIAVDAMGGDEGPGVVVAGVLQAIREYGGKYIVVGDRAAIEEAISAAAGADSAVAGEREAISILHAEDVISMHDSPVEAVREKTRSSLVVAAREVREGRAAALISPGNTGAVLAAGTLLLGRIRGVDRPGIATVIPTSTHFSVLIDVGANVDSRPTHLLHFAIMGSIYARAILGIHDPRIGLLSVGEERSKGNELTKEAFPLLEEFFRTNPQHGRFLGNVEGRDIVNSSADVVVCDGYTGNVVLKFGEALAFAIIDLMRERITATPIRKLAAFMLKGAFREFKKKIDYAEYGGAPLLGVKHPCIICHGSSGPKAIKNAVRVARQALSTDICGRIETMIPRESRNPAIAPINAPSPGMQEKRSVA